MRNLINYLNEHTKYYDEGNPKITDEEWDEAYLRLKAWEENSGTVYPDSPTQRIHYEVKSSLEKAHHSSPMLSLDKIKGDMSAAEAFGKKEKLIISGKMDGLTCRLTYNSGMLIRAETRGDGYVGEDITHNARVISTIPQYIDYNEKLIIDGEVICTDKDFENFSSDYKNSRAFAAGSIRLLDNKECSKRKLTFVAWNVVEGFKENISAEYDLLSLSSYGFTIVPFELTYDKSVEECIEKVAVMCRALGYPIDGCVLKYNRKIAYKEAGSTDHHPKGAFAYKFPDQEYITFLRYIDWTIGRTGVLTPTAVFEPIEIDGATIERASLHNITVMSQLLGDKPYCHQQVKIYRANMITPQIKESIWEDDIPDKKFLTIPDTCPICGKETQLMTLNESTDLVCMNPSCEGKLVNKLDHFAGKKGLEIKGLSKATLERLISWGWVSCASDIFKLKHHKEEWMLKDGFGEKSVNNILSAIKQSEICSLDRFIAALGIPLIGSVASKQLAQKFNTWENFYLATQSEYEFYNLPNFGSEMHDAIIKFNYSEADFIARNFLLIQQTVVNSGKQKLQNMTFCITGKLKSYKNRTELKNLIESNGGKVTDSVSSKTNYLINNDKNSDSSKNKKALSLGIPIITEEEFIKMV